MSDAAVAFHMGRLDDNEPGSLAFAALRLITSSNVVGNCTGRSVTSSASMPLRRRFVAETSDPRQVPTNAPTECQGSCTSRNRSNRSRCSTAPLRPGRD